MRSAAIQPKLKISAPEDKYEQEANRIADEVMRAPHSSGLRKARPVEESQNAETARGRHGQPLDLVTRAFMESRFGRSFGDVRVHTDAHAVSSARVIGARSYTIGRDIVLGRGRYIPGTIEGRRLMAHELTHVCQQTRPKHECGPLGISKAAAPMIQRAPVNDNGSKTLGPDLLYEAIVEGWISDHMFLIQKVRELPDDERKALVGRLTSEHRQLMTSAGLDFLREEKEQNELEKKIFRIEQALHAIALEFEPILAKSVTTSPVLELRKARHAERRRREAEHEKHQLAELERELNQLLAQREGPPPIHPPPHIERRNRQLLPFAKALEFFYAFLPLIGPALGAYYAVAGETLLGEKLSTTERVLNAVFAAIPFAGQIIRAGKTGAHVVLQIARRTNSDPRKVLNTLKRLDALSDEKQLAKFVEAVEARGPRAPKGTEALPASMAPAATATRPRQFVSDAGGESITIQTPGLKTRDPGTGRFAKTTSNVPKEAKGATVRDAGESILGEGTAKKAISIHTGRGLLAEKPRAAVLGYMQFRAGFKIFDGAKRVGHRLRLWSHKTYDPTGKAVDAIFDDMKGRISNEVLKPLKSDLVRRLRTEFNKTKHADVGVRDFEMPRELVGHPSIEIHVDVGFVGAQNPAVAAAEKRLGEWFDEVFPSNAKITFYYEM